MRVKADRAFLKVLRCSVVQFEKMRVAGFTWLRGNACSPSLTPGFSCHVMGRAGKLADDQIGEKNARGKKKSLNAFHVVSSSSF